MQRHPVDHHSLARAQSLRALSRRRAAAATRGGGAERSGRAARGFTLLELMVVVVIIGLVVAGAIISMGATGRDSQLEQERDRLNALIAYARERGALLTLEYGIRCGQHGYRFVYYDNRLMQWLPETLDDTLRVRRLPDGLALQLVIEGREVVLDDKALQLPPAAAGPPAATTLTALGSATPNGALAGGSNAAGSAAFESDLSAHVAQNDPQILLLSDGDMNSFSLTLQRASAHRSVTLRSVSDGTVSASDIVQAPQ
jgi:general secretion pathway protein H